MLIEQAGEQLRQLNDDRREAYIRYQDLRGIPQFKNDTVVAIKAPPETKLRVPDPAEVGGPVMSRFGEGGSVDNNKKILDKLA